MHHQCQCNAYWYAREEVANGEGRGREGERERGREGERGGEEEGKNDRYDRDSDRTRLAVLFSPPYPLNFLSSLFSNKDTTHQYSS
jgi:hypothetical protein